MKEEDEFYIGWQDTATKGYNGIRRTFFFISMVIMIISAVGYLFVENKFIDSYFDYGTLTELEGTVVEYPVFGLRTVIEGKKITVPLVGFGKHDALPVLAKLKLKTSNQPLNNFNVQLQGTIIKYKDKIWMELTEGEESILNINSKNTVEEQSILVQGPKTIFGEIVDPKCFFGVMNPAAKKIHRSCAIRCISGGIPPLLGVRENGVFTDYYFVTDEMGQPINQEILQFIGIPLSVSGEVEQVDDWKVIKINSKKMPETLHVMLDGQIINCDFLSNEQSL
jgi:hypothetical protein